MMCYAIDTLEEGEAIQTDLNKFEKLVHANFMKFKKAKCTVLQLYLF